MRCKQPEEVAMTRRRSFKEIGIFKCIVSRVRRFEKNVPFDLMCASGVVSSEYLIRESETSISYEKFKRESRTKN